MGAMKIGTQSVNNLEPLVPVGPPDPLIPLELLLRVVFFSDLEAWKKRLIGATPYA
jgi:hypothetical protein